MEQTTHSRMRSLIERFTMPPHLARLVAIGERSLSDALLEMQRAETAERLLAEGRVDKHGASQIRGGRMTPDEVQFKMRVREFKIAPAYTETRLDGLQGSDVVLAVMGGALVQGALVALETYTLRVDGPDGPVEIAKHDVKLVFPAAHRKRLLKRGITWGPADARLAPNALNGWTKRRDVKARDLLKKMEDGGVATWTTAEGDQLRGRVTGFNRFEVILETTQGPEVILFRHAFGDLS